MAVVTMRQLLESGVHFGHQTRRWNPKMKRFIFTERNGIYIIDLQQSLSFIDNAYDFVKETVAHGGSILFVGTKKQAQEPIAEQATRVGMPYVNQRWLGGMLTNFQTVHKRLQRLKELEEIDFEDVAKSGMTKKELLVLRREKDKLERTLGGIRDMAKVPSAVWIVDTKKEHLAVDEARKLGIPVVAILDTNCDPDEVDYKIPGNDDAIRSVTLLTRVVADAVADGLMSRSRGGEAAPAQTGAVAADEPLAEWERDLLVGEQDAVAAPAAESAVAEAPATTEPAAGTEAAAPRRPRPPQPRSTAPAEARRGGPRSRRPRPPAPEATRRGRREVTARGTADPEAPDAAPEAADAAAGGHGRGPGDHERGRRGAGARDQGLIRRGSPAARRRGPSRVAQPRRAAPERQPPGRHTRGDAPGDDRHGVTSPRPRHAHRHQARASARPASPRVRTARSS